MFNVLPNLKVSEPIRIETLINTICHVAQLHDPQNTHSLERANANGRT